MIALASPAPIVSKLRPMSQISADEAAFVGAHRFTPSDVRGAAPTFTIALTMSNLRSTARRVNCPSSPAEAAIPPRS
jgi:hypothetical protein